MFSPNIKHNFTEFGDKMQIIGILFILSCVPYIGCVVNIILLVFIFLALGNIKMIAIELNNQDLFQYRSKYITGFILIIFAIIFFIGSFIALIFGGLFIFLAVLIIAIVFFIIGGLLEMQAWGHLNTFFTQYQSSFPQQISNDAIQGSKYMKNAALCYLLAFLIVTLIIGFILNIIGAFKLASLKNLKYEGEQKQIPQTSYTQTIPTAVSAPVTVESKFCPNCGSQIKGNERYCGSCGSEL